jgi:hypothetical protein
MRVFRSLAPIWLFAALPFTAGAQGTQNTQPTDLVVEIKNPNGSAPVFLPAAPTHGKRSSMWTPRFERVPGFEPEPGTLPVRAVNFASSVEGDAARVIVSLHLGVRYFEKEVQVGSYLLREGDSAVVRELASFGVVPFEITAVRPKITAPPLPSVTTRTSSLEVIGIEATKSTIPAYKLSLRNVSSKNIAAIQVSVFEGPRLRLTGSPRGNEGLPLIPAGAILETNVLGAKDTTMTRFGYEPASPPFQTVVVSSLVFEDGSYEGDPAAALRISARIAGERIQVKRAITALKQTLETPRLTASDAIATLTRLVSSLSDEVPSGVANKLTDGLAGRGATETLASLTGTIQSAMHYVKKNLLAEVQAFQTLSQKAPDEAQFHAWLTALFDRYEKWRLRLH